VLATLPFLLTGSMTLLAGLDLLGLGMPPGTPSLGELLAQGKTNPDIAAELAYSLATVRRDTISIYRKLGVSGRVEATAIAIAEMAVKMISRSIARASSLTISRA
jgi:hypothetical protein